MVYYRYNFFRIIIRKGVYAMKQLSIISLFIIGLTCQAYSANSVPPAPNGITIPQNYKDWRVISMSHREDNRTLRVILGNNTAIDASRAGKTNPWPEGTVLAKLVWKDTVHPNWEKATVPGTFVHAEFMMKDSHKYTKTGGWGFARWTGMNQKPYGKDDSFVQECFGCHTPVKDNDYVFTRPAELP